MKDAVMSAGHTATGSFPALPSPEVLWKSSRSTMGPNSPTLWENLAQSMAKNAVLPKNSLSKPPAGSPGRHFPFPVGRTLTTMRTDYSQADARATALPGKGSARLSTPSLKATWQRVSLCIALLQKDTQLLWEPGFRKRAQDVKEAVCHFQRAKRRALLGGLCAGEQGQPLLDTQMPSHQILARSR